MPYNFAQFKDRLKSAEEWLKKEYTGIRTGQATPTILDSVMVESYGSMVPLNQVGNIGIEDARTLKISPWDPSVIKEIEKSIIASNLGLSVRTDDTGLHVSFPQLTADRRTSLIKLAKEKLEEARITVRKEREKVMKDMDAQEEAGAMTEDDIKRGKVELQKHVDEINKKLDEVKDRKEKEIMN